MPVVALLPLLFPVVLARSRFEPTDLELEESGVVARPAGRHDARRPASVLRPRLGARPRPLLARGARHRRRRVLGGRRGPALQPRVGSAVALHQDRGVRRAGCRAAHRVGVRRTARTAARRAGCARHRRRGVAAPRSHGAERHRGGQRGAARGRTDGRSAARGGGAGGPRRHVGALGVVGPARGDRGSALPHRGPAPLAATLGLARTTEWCDFSLVGFGGLLTPGDRFGVLLGVSPKLRVF